MKIQKDKVLNTFISLVKIDSPSGEEEKVRAYIAKELAALGAESRVDSYGNLIAKVEGIGKPLALAAHMDTVQPGEGIKPVVKGDIIKSDGTTILGSDDKAGITEIIETVRSLKQFHLPHRPLELIFTREEETGLKGAFALKVKELRAKEVIILDGDEHILTITTAAPFINDLDIVITGKSAHSGAEPEKGINAVTAAAKAIASVKWGRIDEETTCNVGKFFGGLVRNAVPERVEIQAEVRSHKRKKLDIITKKIKIAFEKGAKGTGARLSWKESLACQGYSHPAGDSFIKELASHAKKVKLPIRYEKSGGASDANVFAGKGMKPVVVSCGVTNGHTVREQVKITAMIKTISFLVSLVSVTK